MNISYPKYQNIKEVEKLRSVPFSFKTVDGIRATQLAFSCFFLLRLFSLSLSLLSFFSSSAAIKNDSATQYLRENNITCYACPTHFFFVCLYFTRAAVADGAAAQTMLDPLRYTHAQQRERRKKSNSYNSLLYRKQMETHHLMLKRRKKK